MLKIQAFLQPKTSPRSFGSQGKRVFHSKSSKKRIKTPLTGQTFGETSLFKMLVRCSGFYNLDSMKCFRILKSELHQALLFGAFSWRMTWKKNRTKVHNIKRSNIRQIKS